MLNVLLSVFLVSGVVFSENPKAEVLRSQISGGIAYPSSDRVHSFYHKSIPCDKKEKWNKDYKQLQENGAFLPKMLIDIGETDDPKVCFVFFKNLFVLDLKIYHNVYLLIESFKRFVKALVKANIYSHFQITPESFAYEPLTRRYVFIDLQKLEPKKEDDNNTNIKLLLVISFLESFKKRKLLISISDSRKMKRLGEIDKEYDRDAIEKSKLNQLTVVEDINSYQKTSSSSPSPLTIDIKDEGNYFGLKVSHEGKQTFFDRIRKKDTFTIYLCRKGEDSYDFKCSNIDEREIKSNFPKNFYVKSDQRIDIEVRESFSQTNDWSPVHKKRTFYEIFIITKPKDAPGISQIQTYYSSNSSLEIKNDDIILCETTSNQMIIYYIQGNKAIKKTFNIDSKNPIMMNSNDIIRVSPYHLKLLPFFDNKQVKRIFYLPEVAKRTIFISSSSSDNLMMISIQKFEVGSDPLFLKNCDELSSGVSFSIDPNNTELKYNSVEKKYPSPIVFLNFPSDSIVNFFCFKENSKDVLIFNLGEKRLDNKSFAWNFNMHLKEDGKKSNKSYVYYIQKKDDSISKLDFRNFAWPIAKPYIVYISIVQINPNNSYSTQVTFFKEDGQLYNILYNSKLKKIKTPKPPVNFIYNKANAYFTTDLVKLPLSSYDAVYRSPDEIVYQVEIPGFQECHPILKLENGDTVRVWCESWMFGYSNPRAYHEENSTAGLDRIADQGKPIVSGGNENSSDPNLSKVARVII